MDRPDLALLAPLKEPCQPSTAGESAEEALADWMKALAQFEEPTTVCISFGALLRLDEVRQKKRQQEALAVGAAGTAAATGGSGSGSAPPSSSDPRTLLMPVIPTCPNARRPCRS